ncbi:MAG: BCR family protein [Firmicutes bacterium ZCTH02-B6]|nr:MAG: BCR family protein [Firmicutes bacterium ZCTH02-B6]
MYRPGVRRWCAVTSYHKDKEALLKRLRRIEGQVRGIQRMVEDDKYCVDILVQIAAARAALDQVGLILLEDHTRGCVARAIKQSEGDADAAITELTDVLRRFLR